MDTVLRLCYTVVQGDSVMDGDKFGFNDII